MAPEPLDPPARKKQDSSQSDGEPSLAASSRAIKGQNSTSNTTGVRRNRLPAGVRPWKIKVRFSPELKLTLLAAALAAGNLSPSLYLERLLAQLADESGTLPVLNPRLDDPSGAERPTAT